MALAGDSEPDSPQYRIGKTLREKAISPISPGGSDPRSGPTMATELGSGRPTEPSSISLESFVATPTPSLDPYMNMNSTPKSSQIERSNDGGKDAAVPTLKRRLCTS